MKYKIIIILLLTVSLGCKSTVTTTEINNLKETVLNNNFEVTLTSATPIAFANVTGIQNLLPPGSNNANINLINISNYFIVKNDSIKVDIPYYGEQQIAMAFKSDNGIVYEGIPEKTKNTFIDKKNKYIINYWLKNKNETFRVTLTLFPNKNSSLSINSSHRTTINYNGYWKPLKN